MYQGLAVGGGCCVVILDLYNVRIVVYNAFFLICNVRFISYNEKQMYMPALLEMAKQMYMPVVGQKFQSVDFGFAFYDVYARAVGDGEGERTS